MRGLSLVAASGGHSSSRCAGLSLSRPLFVAEHKLQPRRLSSCGSRAQLLRGMWDLPRPGLEPLSPASAGRFSTAAPPGKPETKSFYNGSKFWGHYLCLPRLFTLQTSLKRSRTKGTQWLANKTCRMERAVSPSTSTLGISVGDESSCLHLLKLREATNIHQKEHDNCGQPKLSQHLCAPQAKPMEVMEVIPVEVMGLPGWELLVPTPIPPPSWRSPPSNIQSSQWS